MAVSVFILAVLLIIIPVDYFKVIAFPCFQLPIVILIAFNLYLISPILVYYFWLFIIFTRICFWVFYLNTSIRVIVLVFSAIIIKLFIDKFFFISIPCIMLIISFFFS